MFLHLASKFAKLLASDRVANEAKRRFGTAGWGTMQGTFSVADIFTTLLRRAGAAFLGLSLAASAALAQQAPLEVTAPSAVPGGSEMFAKGEECFRCGQHWCFAAPG